MERENIVLYVIDTLAIGGAEKSLLEIASRLTVFKPVVCILKSKKKSLRAEFDRHGIEVIDMDISSKFWWTEGPRKLMKIIKKVDPVIIHATLFKSEIITRIAVRKTGNANIGSFVNDSYAVNRYHNQTTIRNLMLDVVRLADMYTARWVTHFMSISKSIAHTNANALRLSHTRITCIYRGRDVEGFPIVHPEIGQGPFIFLTVARLLQRKGYNELFQAATILAQKGYSFILKVAGEGADYKRFKALVDQLGITHKVEFLGSRSDIPLLLSTAHCFVFPSHYEGQGGSLVEAMLAAKPIIASDIPVFREQIDADRTGKLFRVFDPHDLSVKMEWMLQHYEEAVTLGISARQIAIQRFNIDNTVKDHELLYMKVLSGFVNQISRV